MPPMGRCGAARAALVAAVCNAATAPFTDVVDARIAAWVRASEANVSAGSLLLVLGGNATLHGAAAASALRVGAAAAGAPPMAFDAVHDASNWADADAAFRGVASFVAERGGRYGVVAVPEAAPAWVLKTLAGYFFGQARCGHAALDGPAFACARIVWVLSTSFGAGALASERTGDLDGAVAADAKRAWPSRTHGALAAKAAAAAAFVSAPRSSDALARVHAARRVSQTPVGDALDGVVGQPAAVAAVRARVDAAKRRGPRAARAAPPAVFYLYGAPGAGKTRLGEAAAESLGYPVVRLAMESYASVEDANALFGAPPGLEQSPCVLADLLLEDPRRVVIFDEVEKAHPSLFGEKLHSALSAGTMTHKRDASRTANLSEALFFFTSNCFEAEVARVFAATADDEERQRLLGDSVNDAPRARCSEKRPANPFDDASLRSRVGRRKQFAFGPLGARDLAAVAEVALRRVAADRGLDLAWSTEAVERYAAAAPDARGVAEAVRDDLDRALLDAPAAGGRVVLHVDAPPGPWTRGTGAAAAGPRLAWLDAPAADAPAAVEPAHTTAALRAPAPRETTASAAPRARAAPAAAPAAEPAAAPDVAAYYAYLPFLVALLFFFVARVLAAAMVAAVAPAAAAAAAAALVVLAALAVALGPRRLLALLVLAARAAAAAAALLLRLAASDAARPLILAVLAGALSSRWLARPRRPATATKATATDDDRHPRRRSRSCGPGVGRR